MSSLLTKGMFWLAAEIFLTFVNLDNIADYGEFIFRLRDDMALQRDRVAQVLGPDGLTYPTCALKRVITLKLDSVTLG